MTTIKPSDPRLTAFVLGELPEGEAQEIQSAIDSDAELQQEIEAIRQTVAQIETAMREEPLPENGVSPPVAQPRNSLGTSPAGSRPPLLRRLLFPAAITAIAASLIVALLIAYQQDGQIARHEPETLVALDRSNSPVIPAQAGIQTEDVHPVSLDSYLRGSNEQNQETETTIALLDEIASIPVTTSLPPASPLAHSSPEETTLSGKMAGGMGGLNVPESEQTAPRGIAPPRTAQAPASMSRLSRPSSMPTNSPGKDTLAMDRERGAIRGEARDFARNVIIGLEASPMQPPPSPPMRERALSERESTDRFFRPSDPFNNEKNEAYKEFTENDFTPVKVGEFSTFSVDVDTASYTTMRRYVNDNGTRPPADSVRLEEYINYFKYDYAQPTDGKPFATHVDVFPCPWQPKHLLARIGIKGKEYTVDERPPLNLVFLIDVSGSMSSSNRLPLVKKGLTELVEMLQPKDRVAIVTYAGDSRLVLPSVSGQEKRAILDSVDALNAGGSTNGAGGIRMAYETARKYFDKEAQNRVILCTDGDFNVGPTNNKTLEQMITEEAKSGVFLTILGFGMGNYKDARLKTLSMAGNGNYGYIDSIEECRKLLVEGLTGTLFTIAKDVKIQVDFNPTRVAGYRLLGYENRKLRDEDFHNDAVDAGDIGAGHTVTALYEIVPVGVNLPTTVDRSRYDTSAQPESADVSPPLLEHAEELMFVKLRYKAPDGDKSELLEYPVKFHTQGAGGISPPVVGDSQFASAVALYGMLLRSSRHSGTGSWDTVLELATPNTKKDKYREEFVELVRKAKELR